MLSSTEQRQLDARFAALWNIDPASVIPERERHAASIQDVRKGGVIRIGRKTYSVTSVGTYLETDDDFKPTKKKFVVTELALFCLEDGTYHNIEWEVDDDVAISFTDGKIKGRSMGRSLTYDDGEVVDPSDLEEIVDEEWKLVLHGTTYHYDDDWSAIYTSPRGETYYVFFGEFKAKDGRCLTIEEWADDPKARDADWDYEVFTSVPVLPSSIEVLSLGSEEEPA